MTARTTLCLVLFVVAATGCGGSSDGGVGGGGGGGADGGGGEGGDGGTGGLGSSARPETTVTPASCANDEPSGDSTACDNEGDACSYVTGDCAVTFTCTLVTVDPEMVNGCGPYGLFWRQSGQRGCNDGCTSSACISCGDALGGEACDAPGFSCDDPGGGGNCQSFTVCGGNHTWEIQSQANCCI
jgi:hypothetical protein